MKSKYKKLKDELIKIAKACAPTPEDILVYMGRARRFASFLKESNIQIKSINSIKLRHIGFPTFNSVIELASVQKYSEKN